MSSFSRRPGVPPATPAVAPADDVRALELMGELLDLGVSPDRAAETMSVLAAGRTQFVTELVKADAEWQAERAAAVSEEVELPDFLDDDNPKSQQPPTGMPHSLNIRRVPGVRR